MSRITKKTTKKKVVKTENNKVSIFPTLGIILALIASSVFHYYDNKGIIVNYILDKKELIFEHYAFDEKQQKKA